MVPFLLDIALFNCQLCYEEGQAWLSPSGNSNIKLDINTGLEGVMRGEKMGCAVGETGIHGVRLGIENLKTSRDK